MWQGALRPHVESGEIAVVGIVQEQHPDRARLYRQWRGLDWPIFVDPLDLLDHSRVPIIMGINESGLIVLDAMRTQGDLQVFLNKDFQRVDLPKEPPAHELAGDAPFREGKLDVAVDEYRASLPDPRAWFRLGVALRRRAESERRRPTDEQESVAAWTQALSLDPNQYIWRRRIQQYGPRLAKPYNFYGWIEQARADIRERGETPVPLPVEPGGAERIGQDPAATVQLTDPDPEGRIARDEQDLVLLETVVTPPRVPPGDRVRVRLVFRPAKGLWNNEAEPLSVFVEDVAEGILSHPNAATAESREVRAVEFEVDAREKVKGYALYNVCEKEGGTCLYLRRDFELGIRVDPEAPRLGR